MELYDRVRKGERERERENLKNDLHKDERVFDKGTGKSFYAVWRVSKQVFYRNNFGAVSFDWTTILLSADSPLASAKVNIW